MGALCLLRSGIKGYGQCQETEFFQWGVLPLYTPLTKYPLQREAGHRFLPQMSPSVSAESQDKSCYATSLTCHVIMHPVQHDFGRSVPASGNVAGHLIVSVPRQAEVQDLVKGKKQRCFRLFLFRRDAVERAAGHWPSAHSLHSPPDYWVLNPAGRKVTDVNEVLMKTIKCSLSWITASQVNCLRKPSTPWWWCHKH